jgi:glycerophosphoryl diester phosphodiesterase
MLEIDLHRTRDAAIVVIHDASLSNLGGRGQIADASLEQVRALDAGGGQPVPTLEEVLEAFGERIALNLELKRGRHGEYPGLERAALDAVARRGLLASTLFSSFEDGVLARLRGLAPEARLALLLSPRRAGRALERARALGAEALNPALRMARPELIDAAHAAGLAVYVFTVDEEPDMRRLLAQGADGLFTNFPDRLRRVVDQSHGGEISDPNENR